MSDPIRIADHIWKDGESLVDRLDQLSRSEVSTDVFYQEAVQGLLAVSGGVSVRLNVDQAASSESLARTGVAFSTDLHQEESLSWAGVGKSALATWSAPNRLDAVHRLDEDAAMRMAIEFEHAPTGQASQTLAELCEAVIQIVSFVFLRNQFSQLRSRVDHIGAHEQWMSRLHSGVLLDDSFAAIAGAIAQKTNSDRVCLLSTHGDGFHLVASSTQPVVDRRARPVRLMESLVTTVSKQTQSFCFVVGGPSQHHDDKQTSHALEEYIQASGARSIRVESITDRNEKPIAALMLENFRGADTHDSQQSQSFDEIYPLARSAIGLAVRRDQAALSRIGISVVVRTIGRKLCGQKSIAAMLAVAVVSLLLWLVPAELNLSVRGRIAPKLKRHVFAPRDSKIIAIHVKSGQVVDKGQLLVELQSSELDLLQQQLEGELATARTQLSVAIASRPRLNRTPLGQESDTASNEQVLEAKINGLKEQLAMVIDQQDRLMLVSPISGVVSRWDLQQVLESRPVKHGEQILDVVSPDRGWVAELEIPSDESGYVIAHQNEERCRCVIRMQSSNRTCESTIDEIANVASISETGVPIVMARTTIHQTTQASMVAGASIHASVYCGQRPIGFVWFRSVIQWARKNGWL